MMWRWTSPEAANLQGSAKSYQEPSDTDETLTTGAIQRRQAAPQALNSVGYGLLCV